MFGKRQLWAFYFACVEAFDLDVQKQFPSHFRMLGSLFSYVAIMNVLNRLLTGVPWCCFAVLTQLV